MSMSTKKDELRRACLRGDEEACLAIRDLSGFAEGGLMADVSRLWRMESDYPEFQKGIASKVTKEQIPTTPIEEEYMYSPTQRGYAEGGSVYDETGSMLAPEVPLNFEDDMPMNYPVDMPIEEESELGLTPDETEILKQATSDYPELESILNKVGSVLGNEFTGDGAVDGPGTGTSDSINAKLSDGEFVFTAKAVKQLGVDKLRKQMAKAEEDYDESSMKQEYQQMGDEAFATGGFFTRPTYKDGGEAIDSRDDSSSTGIFRGLGNIIFDAFANWGATIDPDSAEYHPRIAEENKKNIAIEKERVLRGRTPDAITGETKHNKGTTWHKNKFNSLGGRGYGYIDSEGTIYRQDENGHMIDENGNRADMTKDYSDGTESDLDLSINASI